MTDHGSLKRVLLWQLIKIFRAICAENEAKNCFVVLPHTWNEHESPLEGKYIRVFRKIVGQLFIEQPRSTRSDAKGLARVGARKRTTYALERLSARNRGEG